MSIGALDATNAYGRAAGVTPFGNAAPPFAGVEQPDAGGGFGALVSHLVGDAGQGLRAAETASAKQIAGKGDLIDVVTAIGAAESALDTMVAVRDRVVGAYSDIMRMQI
ncbi:flagellar hook-basal body complex protein FliE [Sphingomonas echinoides]|jgi:flagellar hook-basal body complex protein FliE|uniref:flagellar hook-basal body complex protein FliE n=1 Tax=Sphingomonas echinoides TaxID=59803 RepID=UPI0024135ADF|nr:flagellar hook-basal body complex protein FliE [Sphingomonas echinoides]